MSLALPEGWQDWPAEAKKRLLDQLRLEAERHTPRPWRATARPKQLPPEDPMHIGLMPGGIPAAAPGPTTTT